MLTTPPSDTHYIIKCDHCGSHLVAFPVIAIEHIEHDTGETGYRYTIIGRNGRPEVVDEEDREHTLAVGEWMKIYCEMYEIAIAAPESAMMDEFSRDPNRAKPHNIGPHGPVQPFDDGSNLDMSVWGEL